MNLYINKHLNFFIIKEKKLFLCMFIQKNYFIFKINSYFIKNKSNFIVLNWNYLINNSLNSTLSCYINSCCNFFFKKISFKGKGYKIVKKKNFLVLNFNHSHITFIIFFKTIVIKLTKHKYALLLKNLNLLSYSTSLIKKIRPINIYTRRGIKLSKQKVYKKIGKRT